MGLLNDFFAQAKQAIRTLSSNIEEATPAAVKRLRRNRLFIFVTVAAVAGVIGNRIDATLVSRIFPWAQGSTNAQNWWIVVFFLVLVLLVYFFYMSFALSSRLSQLKDDLLANQFRDDKAPEASLLRASDSFYPELTALVTKVPVKSDLLVSIGEGDFINGWLTRIYEDFEAGRGHQPKIQRIIVRCLSDEVCSLLSSQRWISDGFAQRMADNIANLRRLCERQNIILEVRAWPALPPFHGFIFNQRFMTNFWTVNAQGELHVRTPLYDRSAEMSPVSYEAMMDTFSR